MVTLTAGMVIDGVTIGPGLAGEVDETPGSYSWTAPENVTSITFFAVGGGGGGAGGLTLQGTTSTTYRGGGGGAGGEITTTTLSVVPGTSYTVSTGVGGAGGYNGFQSQPLNINNAPGRGQNGTASSISLNGVVLATAAGGNGSLTGASESGQGTFFGGAWLTGGSVTSPAAPQDGYSGGGPAAGGGGATTRYGEGGRGGQGDGNIQPLSGHVGYVNITW